jgi:hypothetical protein
MSYEDFTTRFDGVGNQYNVMALVGNGFDIQVLSNLDAQTDTRYESFYYYLKYRKFNPDNCIFKEMQYLLEKGASNWSDVEYAISSLLSVRKVRPQVISDNLKQIQREFSSFLDQTVTPDVLASLGDAAVGSNRTILSFTEFLGDIKDPKEYNKMILPSRLNIGDLFNYRFINFNYTTLLDDFVYLDQVQFDPHPYKSSDRNITFHPDPRGLGSRERRDFTMVGYLVSDVVHPHGIQYVPRSLLFGVDDMDNERRKLSKPYWAQNEVKYGHLFPDTDLFIIFGCSLGRTDRWWWHAIIDGLKKRDEAELILYWRQERGVDKGFLMESDFRKRFAEAAGYRADNSEVMNILDRKMRVVLYDDKMERAWLNTAADTLPSWASELNLPSSS